MGMFGNSNVKKVSKREFQELRSRLYAKDFDADELDKVAMIFRADLDEPEESQKGIDAGELSRGIAWMRSHTHIHKISTSKIQVLEEILKENL